MSFVNWLEEFLDIFYDARPVNIKNWENNINLINSINEYNDQTNKSLRN